MIGSAAIKVPAQTTQFSGDNVKISTYIEPNVAIAWRGVKGSVTGDIKYFDGNTLFPESENQGNYFPFKLDDSYRGKQIIVKRTSGTKSEKTAADIEWILRLADGVATTYEVSCAGTIIADLSFSGATLAEAE